jgi:hypothetical protein
MNFFYHSNLFILLPLIPVVKTGLESFSDTHCIIPRWEAKEKDDYTHKTDIFRRRFNHIMNIHIENVSRMM